MRSRWIFVVLAICGCATGGGVTETRIDSIVAELIGVPVGATEPGPGASVLVMRGDDVLVRKSYGFADIERRIEATPSTSYRLASVTKQFTAAAILLLVERDALALDDVASLHLPELPIVYDHITIRQLLTHTSGIVDYEDLIPGDATVQVLDRDVLRLVSDSPELYFEPGSSYRYSNSAYALLSLIVERVSGSSFAEFLREEVFSRAQMHRSVAFEDGVSTVPERAFGYSRRDGRWVRTDQSITSAVLGDGGIYSSIEDMARWSRAFHGGTVIGADLAAEATSPFIDTDVEGVAYGYGWRVSEHRGKRVIWHSGETIGFRNVSLYFPQERLSIVVLTNQNETEPHEHALQIADLFL